MQKRKLGNWLEEYLRYQKGTPPNLHSESKESYHTWCGISLICAALQRKCRLTWGTLTFFPNMYIVLVGPSGEARKGTAMGPALKFLEQLRVNKAAEATTREALIRRLFESIGTVESTESRYMESHSSLTVFSPELTCFLGYQNLQLMSDLCDWYDCREEWTYDTKNMGTDDITNIYLNILGATTPSLIESTMPMNAIGGGLTSRMIFVYEDTSDKVPMPFIPESLKHVGKELLHDLEQIKMMHGDFKVTKTFTEYWFDWYMRQPKKCPFDNQRFYGYWARRASHIMKLSMIESVSRGSDMIIEEKDLKKAIITLKAAEIKMPNTFGGVGESRYAGAIQRLMATIAERREISLSELMIMFRRDVDSFEMNKLIETLDTMGAIDVLESTKGTIIIWKRPERKQDAEPTVTQPS